MSTVAAVSAQADATLLKEITKLIHRIERILVPTNSLVHSTIGERLDGLLVEIKKGKYFEDVKKFPLQDLIGYDPKSIEPLFRKVNWEKLGYDIWKTVGENDDTYILPDIVLNEIAMERQVHEEKFQKAANKERVRRMQQRNGLPVIAGKWRKEPYAARKYDFLTEYCVTQNVDEEEARQVKEQLNTPLCGYLGQAYNYDDHGLTEEWMVTFKDKGSAGPSDDEVIRTQIESLMEIMLFAVQDRVCTQTGVLQRPPLQLGQDVKEVPVWGIDCYTRRMVEMSIEDRVPTARRSEAMIRTFMERRLLPAINAQPPAKAHDMTHSVKAIIEDSKSSVLDLEYANAVLEAIREYTIDVFRIHPKGTGVVCINPAGIQPHVFVTEYLGELYPSYRWCERLDVVEQAQQTFELKPTLPDFWNILLERPRQDPNGYGLLYVDASRRANLGSSCSHSCDANCTSAVVARNGKLAIALTTNRYVHYGEELTMDYYSITTSDVEWRAAICLCGSAACRGSFLHYATQDDLQQVLNQSCGPLWRYASLLRACSGRPMAAVDHDVLVRHGMQAAALGENPPLWVKKYAVDNLRFVEFERKALPCALMRAKDGAKSLYTFSAADMDARSVMEQRLQSMVCCFSLVQQVIERNNRHRNDDSSQPLVPYLPGEAVARVWDRLAQIPALLRQHVLDPAKFAVKTAQLSLLQNIRAVASTSSPSSAASSKENAPQAAARSASGTIEGSTSGQSLEANVERAIEQKRAQLKLAEEVVSEVDALLATKPAGFTKLRETCLQLRTVLGKLEPLSTPKARCDSPPLIVLTSCMFTKNPCDAPPRFRINQLVDILAFWAYTMNFSTVQHFNAVESGPIEVYARELGNNIPRSKIYKHYRGADLALRSRDKDKDRRKEGGKEMEPRLPSTASAASLVAPDGDLPDGSDAPAASTTSSESVTNSDADASPSSAPSVEGVTSQAPVVAASVDQHGADEASGDASTDRAESVIEQQSDSMQVEEPTAEDAAEACAGAETVTETGAYSREFYLAPHETVFTGTMKYSELFTFWQLMGWFNAGTDQKTEAPDLFGCVELPEPSHCFGEAEVSYGTKQRDALVALLKDEKKQMMSWPPVLKQSFSLPAVPSLSPLYGSPMLDVTLGQVGIVPKVIAALSENHTITAAATTTASDSAKKGKKGAASATGKGSEAGAKKGAKEKEASKDNTQFDNILPPEAPTSWVQCEKCRKWRRVAWFVDSEKLPDEWECTMNSWDPENATCEAPQDPYDPEAENTLGFGTAEVTVDESNFTAGKKFDLFCNRNKVYYEAVVQKVKRNPKRPSDPPKAQFRFIGWGARFDEWVPINSDRIAPHNLHTNPLTRNPREQEKWQGAKDLYADVSLMTTKKTAVKKEKDEDEADGSAAKGKRKRGPAPGTKKGKKSDAAPGVKAPRVSKAVIAAAYCDDFEDLLAEDNSDGDEGSAAGGVPAQGGTKEVAEVKEESAPREGPSPMVE